MTQQIIEEWYTLNLMTVKDNMNKSASWIGRADGQFLRHRIHQSTDSVMAKDVNSTIQSYGRGKCTDRYQLQFRGYWLAWCGLKIDKVARKKRNNALNAFLSFGLPSFVQCLVFRE